MTDVIKSIRPIGRPEKEVIPEVLIPLIEEYVAKLENIEQRGNSYRYKSSELDTINNQLVSDEYYELFKKHLTYKKIGTYKSSKNKPRALFSMLTKLCGYKDVQATEDNKTIRYCIFPGIIEQN